MIYQNTIHIKTSGRGTREITDLVQEEVRESTIEKGLCNVFVQHTSASIILCENADPAVRTDLETFISGLVKDGDPGFTHTTEGEDDMPAHIRSILTDNSLTIPVHDGRLVLGTWQGVYLYEHRYSMHNRKIFITLYGG